MLMTTRHYILSNYELKYQIQFNDKKNPCKNNTFSLFIALKLIAKNGWYHNKNTSQAMRKNKLLSKKKKQSIIYQLLPILLVLFYLKSCSEVFNIIKLLYPLWSLVKFLINLVSGYLLLIQFTYNCAISTVYAL